MLANILLMTVNILVMTANNLVKVNNSGKRVSTGYFLDVVGKKANMQYSSASIGDFLACIEDLLVNTWGFLRRVREMSANSSVTASTSARMASSWVKWENMLENMKGWLVNMPELLVCNLEKMENS